MASLRSFTSDAINPVIEARLEMSLSANALAKRLGLSRQYMSRAEQGTYSSLNPALLKWVANAQSVHVRDVVKAYENFQAATRRATVEKYEPHPLKRNGSEAPHLTFERWRSGYFTSSTQFSVAFCVHPDSVQKYEDGQQTSMPRQIKEALKEVNLLDPSWEVEATDGRLRA